VDRDGLDTFSAEVCSTLLCTSLAPKREALHCPTRPSKQKASTQHFIFVSTSEEGRNRKSSCQGFHAHETIGDRLYGLVPEVPGSILGAATFPEKQWVPEHGPLSLLRITGGLLRLNIRGSVLETRD
jgi:hypothetical protein